MYTLTQTELANIAQATIVGNFFWEANEQLAKPTEEKVEALISKGKELGIEANMIQAIIKEQLETRFAGKKYLPLIKELEAA